MLSGVQRCPVSSGELPQAIDCTRRPEDTDAPALKESPRKRKESVHTGTQTGDMTSGPPGKLPNEANKNASCLGHWSTRKGIIFKGKCVPDGAHVEGVHILPGRLRGDIWQCLQTVFVVTKGRKVLLVSGGGKEAVQPPALCGISPPG